MGSKRHILCPQASALFPTVQPAQTTGSVHGSVRRNNGSHGQEYQEAGYTAGDRHRPQCWAGGGGTYSASGLRHFTTPQLLCFPSKGRNHGQPFPKAPAALRIKARTPSPPYMQDTGCGGKLGKPKGYLKPALLFNYLPDLVESTPSV